MRVFYYVPETRDFRPVSTNAEIVPIVSFHAVFKSKTGKTEDGGLKRINDSLADVWCQILSAPETTP